MTAGDDRRHRRLLRLYPPAYRRERGPEILATLAEAAEAGHARAPWRESAGLVVGGLRARFGTTGARPVLRLCALLLLVAACAQHAAPVVRLHLVAGSWTPSYDAAAWLPCGAAVAALVLAARGRAALGVVAATASMALTLLASAGVPMPWPYRLADPGLWSAALAIGCMVPLIGRRIAPSRRPQAWLIAVPVATVVLPTALSFPLELQPAAPAALAAGSLLWLLVDPRLTAATAVLVLPTLLAEAVLLPGLTIAILPAMVLGWLPYAGAAALLASAGAVLTRARSRL
jgi:hypothetical protein